MEQKIELNPKYNFNEFLLSIYEFFFVSKFMNWLIMLNMIVIFINIIENNIDVFLSSIIFNIFIIIVPYIKAKQIYDYEKKKENKIIVTNDMFYFVNEFGQCKMRWIEVSHMYNFKNQYIICTKEKSMVIVPKNTFETKEKLVEFNKCIEKNIKKNNGYVINGEKIFMKNFIICTGTMGFSFLCMCIISIMNII